MSNIFQKPKQVAPPDLTALGKEIIREAQINTNCIQIGIIQVFDLTEQSATIRLVFKQVISVAPDGTKTLREHPLLLKCPVMVNFGGDSFMSFPIQPGDYCIVLFNDREIDNWFVNGGVQVPTSGRIHDLSDGLAIVGIRCLQNPIADYLAAGIRIQYAPGSKMDFVANAINSLAALFTHTGNMEITGNLVVDGDFYVEGQVYGNGGTIHLADTLVQTGGKSIHAGNGASGTFDRVTVVDGIVISGS